MSFSTHKFVYNNIETLELVSGDVEIAKLLVLLALFSPVGIILGKEEASCLKQFQGKITIMIYSHLLDKETFDNVTALESVSKLEKVMENMKNKIVIQIKIIFNCVPIL